MLFVRTRASFMSVATSERQYVERRYGYGGYRRHYGYYPYGGYRRHYGYSPYGRPIAVNYGPPYGSYRSWSRPWGYGYGYGYGGVGRRWPAPYVDGYERSGYEERPATRQRRF